MVCVDLLCYFVWRDLRDQGATNHRRRYRPECAAGANIELGQRWKDDHRVRTVSDVIALSL